MTRNGHFEFIQEYIRDAIKVCNTGSTQLIINADDPYIAALASTNAVSFGIKNTINQHTNVEKGTYDDGAFCPVCKARMSYIWRIAAHYGNYRCTICGFHRPQPDIEVSDLDFETGEITIIPNAGLKTPIEQQKQIKTHLKPPSFNSAYNLAAAVAVALEAGLNPDDTAKALDCYEHKGGRTVSFKAGSRKGIFLISKHENSLSYNQTFTWIAGQKKPSTVIIMVDRISRKYYTSETSWLWDVNVDILADENIKEIALVGHYSNELMARFTLSKVPPEKYIQLPDEEALHDYISQCKTDSIYAVTCFADKAKLLKAVQS